MTGSIRGLIDILCRIDGASLAQVPMHGPLILISNHINFLEVPALYTYLMPRPATGFAKAESWQNPIKRFLFDLGGGIPLNRGEADVAAFRRALAVLEAGYILAVAPEGTRSGDGRLGQAHPGVVLLALRSGAPLLPVVHYGGEAFWQNIYRLRRTDVHFAVGRPFYLDPHGERVTQAVRRQMLDEVMYEMAALLPPAYRGAYANLEAATKRYIVYR